MSAFQAAHFLRQQAWFGALAAEDQDFALAHAATRRVRLGEVALASGARPLAWHGVISGTLLVERRSAGGAVASLEAAGPGDWLDEEHLVRACERPHDVVAYSDAELLVLDQEAFHGLLQRSPRFQSTVMGFLAGRVERATALVEVTRTADAEGRLAHWLMRWHEGHRQRVRLTQETLGRLAGVSRQTANRVLGGLQARGIVHLQEGQVLQIDGEALAGWLLDRANGAVPACRPVAG